MRTYALFADLPDGTSVCLEAPTDDYAGVKQRFLALVSAGGREGDTQYARAEIWASTGRIRRGKFAVDGQVLPDPSRNTPDAEGHRKPRASAPAPEAPKGEQEPALEEALKAAEEAEAAALSAPEDMPRQAKAALTRKAKAARQLADKLQAEGA
jgi:hypothetical protein